MSVSGLCQICESRPAQERCSNCGTLVCAVHYEDSMGCVPTAPRRHSRAPGTTTWRSTSSDPTDETEDSNLVTSIRDLLGESLGVGETYRLRLEEHDGTLVADHPNDSSPMDIAVVEGLDGLEAGRRRSQSRWKSSLEWSAVGSRASSRCRFDHR